MTIPLYALPVVVSSAMAGVKKAIKLRGRLFVSPAMYDLIKHAEGGELRKLLAAIPLTDLDAMFPPPRLWPEDV